MSEFYKFKLLELMKRNAPLAEIKALGLGEKFKLDELLIFLKNKLFKDHGTKSAHRDLVYLKMTLQDISITEDVVEYSSIKKPSIKSSATHVTGDIVAFILKASPSLYEGVKSNVNGHIG